MSGYSRDVVVNCLTRHYDLLVRMGYLDASAVQQPSEGGGGGGGGGGGWSDADLRVDALRAMGRSEAVVDLLRHIPYLRESETADPVEIFTETFPLRYLRDGRWFGGGGALPADLADTPLLDLGFAPFDGPVPADFVSLTHADEGTWWLVDTREGLIYPYGTEFEGQGGFPEGQPWRAVEPVPIQAYFDGIYAQIASLEVVPAPRSGKWEARVVAGQTAEGQEVKRLYHEHGWPHAFRREEFIQAVEKQRAAVIEAEFGNAGDEDEDEEMTG